MKRAMAWFAILTLGLLVRGDDAHGRGFGGGGFGGGGFSRGGFGGGSFGGGGFDRSSFSGGSFDRGSFGGFGGAGEYHSSSYGGYHSSSFGGNDRSSSFSSERSGDSYAGWRGGAGATSSYDRSYTGSHGGSVDVDGTRGAVRTPWGGAAAGGSRDVNATGPDGRTYSNSREGGAAVGPYGRTVAGGERSGSVSGDRGSASWQSAFGGYRSPGDFGLSHYSSFGTASVGHSTAYWSSGATTARAGYIRGGFGYYNCFRPAWYTAHPGCWAAAGWAAGTAWQAATWPALTSWVNVAGDPVDYDYGSTIVYQDNNVYVNGQDTGSVQNYNQQATNLATQGEAANTTPQQEWKPLGVFALAQGTDKNSNNIFQLAINRDGIIRGNYYDGLMDSTTPVYGSVDKNTQRAAWSIGKKNERVFETGLYNLTKSETPVLVHIGTTQTQQWLLVRVEQPQNSQ